LPVSEKSSRYVAFLRGINVGGKNKLSMKDLANVFDAAGASDVKTYIQSGNVAFSLAPELADSFASEVETRIRKKLKLSVPIVLRSAKELARVVAKNPFAKRPSADAIFVLFLADKPEKSAIAALDPSRSPPDEFAVLNREVYLFCPNGVGKTKLTNAWFDSKLGTVSTGRNWRTVLTMLELAGK
jgi:uncharacterized protein (DUF1697 family)